MTRLRLAVTLAACFLWAMWQDLRSAHHYDLIDPGP